MSSIFTKISDESWGKILSLYNIGKIVVNKDIYPWFGFKHDESIKEIEDILDSKFKYIKNGSMLIYDNKYFFARISTSVKPILVGQSEFLKR